MILKGFKTIREHWKKSLLFSIAAFYGAKYCHGLYRDSLLRKKYCQQAREYGLLPIKDGEKTRKVTVFLNPAAQNGKARQLFEKNVAPLLFLAGLQVTTVKTEHAGQAKRYMEVVDPADTDAIIVAGGDGTLGEVVTGILRRPDQENFSKIPIGLVPVGFTNTLANAVHSRGESTVGWLCELGMAIVKQTARPIDVMQIKSNAGKTVYAVNSLNWGEYQYCQDRKSKYWFVGPLKHRLTYVMSTFTSWPPTRRADLAVGDVCRGCSSCYTAPPPTPARWWHGVSKPQTHAPPEHATRDNPECGVLHSKILNTIEFRTETRNLAQDSQEQKESSLKVYVGPGDISKSDFIKEGWTRLRHSASHANDNLFTVSHFTLNPELKEEEETMFNIDNELYEAMPIEVTLLKNKLTLFCPATVPAT